MRVECLVVTSCVGTAVGSGQLRSPTGHAHVVVNMYSASKNKIHWLRNPNIVPYCKQSHYIMLLRDLCACPKSVQLHYSDRYF